MGMEHLRYVAGNWKRAIKGAAGRAAAKAGEAVSKAKSAVSRGVEGAKQKASRVRSEHYPSDFDISGSAGHAASSKPGATMSDVSAANAARRQSTRRKVGGAAAGLGVAAGAGHLINRVMKTRAAAAKMARNRRIAAGVGAAGAAGAGMMLLRRRNRGNKKK